MRLGTRRPRGPPRLSSVGTTASVRARPGSTTAHGRATATVHPPPTHQTVATQRGGLGSRVWLIRISPSHRRRRSPGAGSCTGWSRHRHAPLPRPQHSSRSVGVRGLLPGVAPSRRTPLSHVTCGFCRPCAAVSQPHLAPPFGVACPGASSIAQRPRGKEQARGVSEQ